MRSAVGTSEATSPRALASGTAGLITLLILTGMFAAAQVGKAIICMPVIRAEMHLGLDVAGVLVAVFATLGALGGVGAAKAAMALVSTTATAFRMHWLLFPERLCSLKAMISPKPISGQPKARDHQLNTASSNIAVMVIGDSLNYSDA